MNQNQQLEDRKILRIGGPDAATFLQNIFTNDIRKVSGDVLQYNLLLTPQGQVLHDVFIFFRDNAYFLDVETARVEDLLKRLKIFKLRAQIEISETGLHVIAGTEGMKDPRHTKLGHRLYTDKTAQGQGYDDLCISLGIPNGTKTIRYEKDFSHDVNLDLLNGIAWDKGCFIGQEVAARVHNRGLAKKRLMIVQGQGLAVGEDIRQVNTAGTQGLAVLRLDSLPENALKPDHLP